MTRAEFEGYFFARDMFVGVGMRLLEGEENSVVGDEGESVVGKRWPTIEDARGEREWKDTISGFYDVRFSLVSYSRVSSH
jgi:hypothetical protein